MVVIPVPDFAGLSARTDVTTGVRVIGESLIDIVEGAGTEQMHPGGSPMNVAFGLGRLGVETELLTYLADDAAGRSVIDHLHGAGVTIDPASLSAAATSTATARIRDDGSADYEFDIEWVLPTPTDPSSVEWTHIGSVSTVLTPGADELESSIQELRGTGALSYDPNIRAALMPPHKPSLERVERFVSLCDVVKLSDEDAAWLYPESTADAVLDRLLELGCGVAVITRGGDGARLASASARVDVAARPAVVVDTIGAGDSFMSALIAALRGATFNPSSEELGRVGTIAATAAMITVSRAGARPPTLSELREELSRGRSA